MNTNLGPWAPSRFVPTHLGYNKLKNLTKLSTEFIPIKNLKIGNSREMLNNIKEIRARNISYIGIHEERRPENVKEPGLHEIWLEILFY